ncbi:hypothetical protein CE91St46_11550 [Eubacteriales bacterium]|nr:hypothetical protein CE91St46_11550 [Eubacteriales bacterium]GKH62680.1 hypothetical protein CE91St47_11490 [Eubacteriales bacterium]
MLSLCQSVRKLNLVLAFAVRETFSDFGVVFTDRAMVLASSGDVFPDGVLPVPAYRALNEGTVTVRDYPGENPETPLLEKAAIAVPLTHDSYPIGVLMFIVPMGRNLILDADVRTTESLAQLFSTMLELGEFQKQSVLRQQAEFRALQSQINPHFFITRSIPSRLSAAPIPAVRGKQFWYWPITSGRA